MNAVLRAHPEFGLCGLNCLLCPMRLGGHCPGCGGEGHASCALRRCAQDRGGLEFCFECGDFPCARLENAPEYDIFISHLRQIDNLRRAKEIGMDAYLDEVRQRADILTFLLEKCNDGRKKTLFAQAANLLDLDALMKIAAQIRDSALPDLPDRAKLAASLLQDAAGAQGISLRLRRKPKNP